MTCQTCNDEGAVFDKHTVDACRECAWKAEMEWLQRQRIDGKRGPDNVTYLPFDDGRTAA